jgi:FlgD Ig-like domain
MSYDFHPGADRDWKDFFPGRNVIDVLAWDGYPKGSTRDANQQLTPPGDFMAPGIAAARSVGLPFGFAEFALSTPAGRPGWVKEVANYLIHQGALFGSLFQGYHNNPAMILNDRASIAVWRGFVSASAGPGAQPAPSRTPAARPTRPAPSPAPPPGRLSVSGLAVSPASLAAGGRHHTKIVFRLSQAAGVTAQIVNRQGAVVRTLARPRHRAGVVHIPYYGYDGSGHREPAGRYTVRVTASNGHGRDEAVVTLRITRG